MRAWVDGRLLAGPHDPAVAVTDRGLTVGEGVFQTLKVVDGLPFALDLHLDRLERGAAVLGLGVPDRDALRAGVRAVLGAEHLGLGRLRVTVTGGPAPLGPSQGRGTPTLVVVADVMGEWPVTAEVVTVPWPRNERSPLVGVKTTSYADNVVAMAEARRRGASEGVLANLAGDLCEGTSTNVFYAVDGELRTPSPAGGCLPGVTRALVLEWCGGREVDEPIDQVRERASEVLLTSTTRDVQPVTRWDDGEWDAPGPVALAVQAVWRERAPSLLGM